MAWGERKGAFRGTSAAGRLWLVRSYSQILTYQKRVGGGAVGLFEALVSIIHGMLLLPPIVVLIAKLYGIS